MLLSRISCNLGPNSNGERYLATLPSVRFYPQIMSRHWDISSFGGLGGASHFGRSVSQSKRLKIDDFTGLVLFLFVSLMGELAELAHPGNVPLRRARLVEADQKS